MSKVNPFDQYAIAPKDYEIKSLGATVTLRKLSLDQSQSFLDKSVKGMDSNDNPIIDVKAIQEGNFHKVSMGLVEPKMTVKQLKELGAGAKDAMKEILEIIDPLPKVGKD